MLYSDGEEAKLVAVRMEEWVRRERKEQCRDSESLAGWIPVFQGK